MIGTVADARSRLGFTDEEQFAQEERELRSPMSNFAPRIATSKVSMLGECWSAATFKDSQRRDLVLSAACTTLNGEMSIQLSSDDPEHGHRLKCLLQDTNIVLSHDGILHRTSPQGKLQIIVPVALVPKVLRLGHDAAASGHQGFKKTLSRVLDRFWWSTVRKDV